MDLSKLLFVFQMIHHNDVMQKITEISFSNDRILYLIILKSNRRAQFKIKTSNSTYSTQRER